MRGQAFLHYGTIGWFPELMLEEGKLDLKIFTTRQPVKLFIEGMTEDGTVISEEVTKDPDQET